MSFMTNTTQTASISSVPYLQHAKCPPGRQTPAASPMMAPLRAETGPTSKTIYGHALQDAKLLRRRRARGARLYHAEQRARRGARPFRGVFKSERPFCLCLRISARRTTTMPANRSQSVSSFESKTSGARATRALTSPARRPAPTLSCPRPPRTHLPTPLPPPLAAHPPPWASRMARLGQPTDTRYPSTCAPIWSN